MKNLSLILILIIFPILLCGCQKSSFKSENALSHAKLMNKLVVGVKSDSKPFGFIDKKGNPAGFDIDIARGIARYILGDDKAVEFVYVTPNTRIPLLNEGKIDMAIAIMSITQKRSEVVNFSTPYYQAGQAILVKNNSRIAALSDLNKRDVGFVLGTTGERTIRKLAPGANLRAAKTYTDLFELLKKDEIEAILADDSVLYGIISDNAGYKMLPNRYTIEYYGVAIRKDKESEELLEEVNNAIEYMRQKGEIDKIKSKWLPSYPKG